MCASIPEPLDTPSNFVCMWRGGERPLGLVSAQSSAVLSAHGVSCGLSVPHEARQVVRNLQKHCGVGESTQSCDAAAAVQRTRRLQPRALLYKGPRTLPYALSSQPLDSVFCSSMLFSDIFAPCPRPVYVISVILDVLRGILRSSSLLQLSLSSATLVVVGPNADIVYANRASLPLSLADHRSSV